MLSKKELFNAKSSSNPIKPDMEIDVKNVGSYPDTDKDGISNSIETNDLDTSTTARDSDSDGISDGLEYLMGSSEKDPASVPAFTIPERPESSSSTSSSSSSSSSSSKKSSSSSSSSEDTESETDDDDDDASLG